jgi:phosphoribosylamine--glycine ligase
MAANGYPGNYAKGSVIKGIERAATQDDVEIFHAGTKSERSQLVANGGRVLGVAAMAYTVAEAQNRAYAAVDEIDWPGGFCRRDIGYLAVEREKSGR